MMLQGFGLEDMSETGMLGASDSHLSNLAGNMLLGRGCPSFFCTTPGLLRMTMKVLLVAAVTQ